MTTLTKRPRHETLNITFMRYVGVGSEFPKMHRLLTRNLTATDQLFKGKDAEPMQFLLQHYLLSEVPETLADFDVNAHLAPDQALHLKELIALALIRQWLKLDSTPKRLYLLPLFTVQHLPQYKSFLAEEIAADDNISLEEGTWTLVKAATDTNNALLIQWCQQVLLIDE